MFEKKRISENILILKKNLENQNNWDDFEQTNKDLKKLNYLSNFLKSIDEIESSYEDTIELLKITDENFDTEVLKSSKPIVVDFWAEWCGPCKMVGPILEEISDEMANDVSIAKHNIDEEPNTPTKYGVRGIPTMLLFKDGELKSTKVGATPKSDIVSWIKENI